MTAARVCPGTGISLAGMTSIENSARIAQTRASRELSLAGDGLSVG